MIEVDLGRSEVVFRFRTPGLNRGMAVSALALLLVLLALAWQSRAAKLQTHVREGYVG